MTRSTSTVAAGKIHSFGVLKQALGLSNDELYNVFAEWNRGKLDSYLIEITRDIFSVKDPDSDADLVDMNKLEAFSAHIPNFTFAACVTGAESTYPKKGYVTQHIEPGHLHDGNEDIYLCGPPPMVDAVNYFIREKGIQPASFHYEKFSASA